MGLPKLALPFALAYFLLAGPFLTAEAARSRCKQQQQVRERKPTFEILHWQEACLPLAVVLGGCCGLVWWLFLAICSACQKGRQNGLPQVLCEVEPEEQKTTTLICQEEWTDAGDELDSKGPSTGNEYRHVEFEPRPPSPVLPAPSSQPREQGNTPIWSYLEQELGKILLAIRSHRTTGQSPMVEEVMSPPPVEKPNNLAADWQNVQAVMTQQPLMVAGPKPPAVEQPNNMAADWQNFLAQMKQQYPLMAAGPSSPAADKPQPLTGEGPSPGAVENQNPPSGKGQSSPHKEKKKTPNRPRSRSKTKSHTSPSSRNQGSSLGRKGRSCRDY